MTDSEKENKLNINLDKLNSLSDEERAMALEILKQYATEGQSELFDDLKYADFEEVPVDIHTFMHDPQYLGRALYDPEGKFTIFPYWEECLEDIFPDNISTKYNNIVFTGAIGLGKSTIAVICLLYLLYRLLCLKDPYLYYGMMPTDKISISLMNITLENAKGVALDKMNQMILASDWFMAHGEMAGTANLVFRPEKHIEIVVASSNNQIIGRALFANFTDEVNFSLVNNPERQKRKMMKLITQIDARMKSRFLRGTYLPTVNIIASSKDTEQSFLEEYIDNKRETESKNTLIIDEPQWIVDSRKDTTEKFWVGIGNKFLANELLPLDITESELDEFRKKGYELWQVPMGYLDTFQQNLDEAICSIIGIATASALKYISGIKVNEAKTDTYQNPFVKDVIEVGNAPDDHLQYANFFDMTRIDEKDLARPMFIHLDMSMSGDKTGIAGVWITGRESNVKAIPQIEGNTAAALEETSLESANDLHYKLAFSVSIKAPKGAQVSFAKNRNFIRWLREQGFSIKGVSCFKGDTLISTPNGNKKIKDIQIGDIVYAFDDNKHEIVESTVYNAVNNGPKDTFIKLWISEEDYIECTPNHLIKTNRGYIKAEDITENDSIEIDEFTYYKNKLLHTNYFIDNESLTEYIKLICKNLNNSDNIELYREKHHIIPKSYFKLQSKQVDNSELNLCSLSYEEHMLAHCLLTKCTIEPLKSKTISAITMMMSHTRLLSQVDIDNFINNAELQNLVLDCKSGKKHTEDEIARISLSNKKPHNIHPRSEWKKGNVPWNAGMSWVDKFSEKELKEKFSHNKEYKWVTNGVEEKLVEKSQKLDEGWKIGRKKISSEVKLKISKTVREKGIKPNVKPGYRWYTDGKINIKVYNKLDIVEGFTPGRTMNTSKTREKNFLSSETFINININEYINFFKNHSRSETCKKFNISINNHKKLCKYYHIHKNQRGEIICSAE